MLSKCVTHSALYCTVSTDQITEQTMNGPRLPMQCQCPLKLRVTTVTVAGPSCPAYHNSMSRVSAPTVAEWAHMQRG